MHFAIPFEGARAEGSATVLSERSISGRVDPNKTDSFYDDYILEKPLWTLN